MAAPYEGCNLLKCFCCAIVLSLFYQTLCDEKEPVEDVLLCRQCGAEITKSISLVNVPSSLAKRQRNDTILGQRGVLIQLFVNPQGKHFEVITSTDAEIAKQKQAFAEYSWFPHFSWRICSCPRCGFHLGWFFERLKSSMNDHLPSSFVGLILENLLHKDYADSLLIIPKAYRS